MVLQTVAGHRIGEDAEDLKAWMSGLSGCPAVTHTLQTACSSDKHGETPATWFYVEGDPHNGIARRRCLSCGEVSHLLDSAEHWNYPAMWCCKGCQQARRRRPLRRVRPVRRRHRHAGAGPHARRRRERRLTHSAFDRRLPAHCRYAPVAVGGHPRPRQGPRPAARGLGRRRPGRPRHPRRRLGRRRLAGPALRPRLRTARRPRQQRRPSAARPAARGRQGDAGRCTGRGGARDRVPYRQGATGGRGLSRHGRPRLRAQPHPVGQRESQPACTYLTATARHGRLEDVALHSLPRMLGTELRGGAR
jgi:hypothetical protein